MKPSVKSNSYIAQQKIKQKYQNNFDNKSQAQLGFLKNPMEENFFDMIRISIFPCYKWLSFTTLIVIVDAIVYTVSLFYDELDENGGFLAPSQYTLYHFGEIYPQQMRNGQYHRFITPIFIHSNFLHFVFSVFVKIYFLSFLEYVQGFIKTIIIYFMVSTYGVVFNAIFTNNPGVGGSFAFGIILICLIQEHNIFQQTKNSNLYAFFSSSHESHVLPLIKSLFILMMIYISNQIYPNIPMIGHCGSYLMGHLLSKYFAPQIANPKESRTVKLWLLLSVLIYIGTVYTFLKIPSIQISETYQQGI